MKGDGLKILPRCRWVFSGDCATYGERIHMMKSGCRSRLAKMGGIRKIRPIISIA